MSINFWMTLSRERTKVTKVTIFRRNTSLACENINSQQGDSDVGDIVMLVIFSMYLIGHQHPESVTNTPNLSPKHLVSNIRHQHRCNPQHCLEPDPFR